MKKTGSLLYTMFFFLQKVFLFYKNTKKYQKNKL